MTAASAFSQLLRERRDQIVACFVRMVQQGHLSPPSVTRSLLVDHIPVFLDEIVAELSYRDEISFSRDTFDTSATARRHGEQRWHLGYDLEALIREYGILRHCIIETAKQNSVAITLDEFDVLAKCLSVGVAEAATEYIKYRDQQLDAHKANLEFLVEAGEALASSLDYRTTLSRLTGLLVPRMADWCAVHLEGDGGDEMAISHVDPSMVEVIQDIYRRYPGPAESPHGYSHVLRTAEPQLTTEAAPDLFERTANDEEHLSLLRQVGTRSWLILPLRVQGNIVGALTLAHSSSGRRYDSSSLMLAGELARRATTAIDNARLYDLSQKERSRVEAATRAKDEFVAMVSHELRTPLNAILGWARLIRSGSLDEGKKKHAFEVIERNAEAQNQLVADLLDISRVITGKIRINPSQVDLSNVVEMAVEGVRPAAEAKRIRLDLEIDRDNAVMRGDGERLQQVV